MSFASVVEIEINSNCNLACSYCPNSEHERIEQGNMKKELFSKIIDQLAKIGFRGKLAFDFYNEPTLSPNFYNFMREAKDKLPGVFIEIYSNGTKITKVEDVKKLLSSGVDKFIVTKHEGIKELRLEGLVNELNPTERDYFVIREHEELRLSNRGGILTSIYDGGTLASPCQIPSLITTITLEGNVLPCFEDFNQKNVMGNVNNESILDIWNKEIYREFRENLKNGHREKYDICRNCNRLSESEMNSKKEKHLLGDEEINAVARVIRSGKLFRYDRDAGECKKFEINFAKELDVENALLVTSGTNALVAALMASKIGPGDEVIIPAYTFVATATAVINVGAVPVVVNIDEGLGLDVDDFKLAINDRTKAVIPVHMDGISCEIEKIVMIANDNNITVIEDACQAMGAKLNGKYLGTFGNFGCFSLNMDKVLTAGEGGIVVSKTKESGETLKCISDAGFPFGEIQINSFKEITPFLGRSMRVSEITGAIINEQFKKKDKILAEYRERKKIIVDTLNNSDVFDILEIVNPNEDCAIKIHLKFKSPLHAQMYGKKLRDEKILVYPPFVRRAHLAWHWMDILGDRSEINKKRNPYSITDKKYEYKKSDFAKSVSIIMNVLILDIDINLTLSQVQAIANKVESLTKRKV